MAQAASAAEWALTQSLMPALHGCIQILSTKPLTLSIEAMLFLTALLTLTQRS